MFALYDTLETILPTIAGFAPNFPKSRQLINNFHDYKGYIHIQKKNHKSLGQWVVFWACYLATFSCVP